MSGRVQESTTRITFFNVEVNLSNIDKKGNPRPKHRQALSFGYFARLGGMQVVANAGSPAADSLRQRSSCEILIALTSSLLAH